MTDNDEAKSSAFDHFEDSQDLIHTPQEQQSNVHEHITARNLCLDSARKDSMCEKSSQESYIGDRSSRLFTHLTTVPTNALLDDSDSEIDLPDSTGNLFQPECNITLSTGSSTRHFAESPANTLDRDTSTDFSPDPGSPFKLAKSQGLSRSALNLKAIFDHRYRRKWRRQAHQRCKEKPKEGEKSTGRPRGRPRLTAPQEERKRRLLDRGFQFPFVEKEYGRKHLPMKMIFEYEEAALKGYFQYIKMLKYEEHLKKALKSLDASEDLEYECMNMRKHKYLDDEGPISPIQETNGEDHNLDPNQEFGATIVENSCFILSSKLPSKKKSKTKAKHVKLISEDEEEETCR